MTNILIPEGHKFAIVALPAAVELDQPDPVSLGPNAWAAQRLAMELPEHWEKWLGTLTLEVIERATLFLLVTAQSKTLDVLDGENADLVTQVGLLYFGLLVAAPRLTHERGVQLNGAQKSGESDVRQFGFRPALCNVDGVLAACVTAADLHDAWTIKETLHNVEGKRGFRRVRAALKAYYRGLQEPDPAIRAHEFVRCIEAFILPEEGKTRQRFRSRTELFGGPGWHELMGQLFDIRSAEEHMNDRLEVIVAPSERGKILQLLQAAHAAQAIAQHSLRNVLTNPLLFENFNGDAATAAFWRSPRQERERLWGMRLNLDTVLAEVDSDLVGWPEVGLTGSPDP